MTCKGKIVWADGGKFEAAVKTSKWTALVKIYSDSNPDKFKAGDEIEFRIERVEAKNVEKSSLAVELAEMIMHHNSEFFKASNKVKYKWPDIVAKAREYMKAAGIE